MCKCDAEYVPKITSYKPAVSTMQTEPATTLPDTTPPITEEMTTTIEMTTNIQVPTQMPF